MANNIDWGQGANNNTIGWGQGAFNNNISWGKSHYTSNSGETDIVGNEGGIVTNFKDRILLDTGIFEAQSCLLTILENLDVNIVIPDTPPAPTVYSFSVSECCGSCEATVYSSSPSIIVGTALYTNIGLTTVFTSGCPTIRVGVCLPIEEGSFADDGFTLNGSGVVTSINQFVNCQ